MQPAQAQYQAQYQSWGRYPKVRQHVRDEFFELTRTSDTDYVYTVAWVDCFAQGSQLGWGLFIRGNFTAAATSPRQESRPALSLTIPFDIPPCLLNTYSLKAFNWLYYYKQYKRSVQRLVPYTSFFYPLDAIGNWNRLYGARGFFQYQCVVPFVTGTRVIADLLIRIAKSGLGSSLAVCAEFSSLLSALGDVGSR